MSSQMLIEYVVFAALVFAALAATFVGMRRRRRDMLSGDHSVTFPLAADGSSSTEGAHHSVHSGGDFDGGGGSHGGGFDGSGGSHGGSFDGGGGHGD
jgi:hypothetical protein